MPNSVEWLLWFIADAIHIEDFLIKVVQLLLHFFNTAFFVFLFAIVLHIFIQQDVDSENPHKMHILSSSYDEQGALQKNARHTLFDLYLATKEESTVALLRQIYTVSS